MNRRTLLVSLPALAATSALAAGAPAERPPADAVLYQSLAQLRQLAAKGPTIVYFHAEWCPTCQATMVNFRARWPEVQPGITLVIADYDKEAELKSVFGVTYQNSYVQVGADGAKLQIWNGGGIKALNERVIFPTQ